MNLKYIFTLIGLVKLPEPHEKAVLLKFIKDYYGNLSATELKLAFEFALQNDRNDDLKHFQTFSVQYLSKVIKMFLEERKKVVKVLMKEKQKEMHQEKDLTPEQIQKGFEYVDREIIFNGWLNYCKTGVVDFGNYPVSLVYEDLEDRHKLINVNLETKQKMFSAHESKVDREIKKQSIEKASNRKEFTVKKMMKEMLEGKHEKKRQNMIKESCRLELITDLFEKWSEEFADVESILKLK